MIDIQLNEEGGMTRVSAEAYVCRVHPAERPQALLDPVLKASAANHGVALLLLRLGVRLAKAKVR